MPPPARSTQQLLALLLDPHLQGGAQALCDAGHACASLVLPVGVVLTRRCACPPPRVVGKYVQRAIHEAYTTTNDEIATRLDAAMEAGSCAVTAMVTRVGRTPFLFCANAGDCRAVLYTVDNNGVRRAVRLSEDHKPHPNVCPREITRICEAGGCVLWGRVQVRG